MTGTYAVAIYTVGEDNKIHIVRADSPAQAIIKAIMQEGESKSLEILGYYREGVAEFDQARLEDVDYLTGQFAQWEHFVSTPMRIS